MSTTIARIDEKKIHKSPRGLAIWPKLITPETKFDPAGVYELRMKFDEKTEIVFFDQMMDLYEQAYRQTLQDESRTEIERENPPWKRNKEGRWEFKFKLKAGGVWNGEKWTNKPPKLFDSRGNLIENPDPQKLRIGSGSEVRTYFQVRPYCVQKAGITLRLKAVQILKLTEYDDAKHYGIDDENDGAGYVYEQPKRQPALPIRGPSVGEPEMSLIEEDDDAHAPIAPTTITDDDIPF